MSVEMYDVVLYLVSMGRLDDRRRRPMVKGQSSKLFKQG